MNETSQVLKDRYEIERALGRGGMSVVYLAKDRQLMSRRVVVKVLLEETSQDPWVRQKFLQEMEALARIDHPGVVGVLDTGLTPEGKQFLVMQYVEGDTLRSSVQAGPMEMGRAANIICQVGQALAAAHEKGVWHRDLKPENIMLQQLGGVDHVKLIDFGIAGIQNSAFTGEQTKVAGSLTYMAPEQFAGSPCAASDTYALGVVAYEILTGKKPFEGNSMSHLVSDQTLVGMPHQLRPELPEAAERAILRAISFQPEKRQASVREFSEELERALTRSAPEPVAPAKSNRKVFLGAAIAVLLAVLAGAGWMWFGGEPQELKYSMVVQKAGQETWTKVPGEMFFESGDSVAFQVATPGPGNFYLLNDGKDETTGKRELRLLEPSASKPSNRAAAAMVRVPPKNGFGLDAAAGPETVYMVFSKDPLPQIEEMKATGVLQVPAKIDALVGQLKTHSSVTNKTEELTEVKTRDKVLVHPLVLQHR